MLCRNFVTLRFVTAYKGFVSVRIDSLDLVQLNLKLDGLSFESDYLIGT